MSFSVYPNVPGPFSDGSVTNPSITFILDPNTGFWRAGSGVVGVTGDGLEVARFQAPAGANPQVLLADGTLALPSLSWALDPNTGFFKDATADEIHVSAGGVLVADLWGNGVSGGVRAGFGSATLPSFSFVSDNDSGMYRAAGNTPAIATAGSARWFFDGNTFEGRQTAMTITTSTSGNALTVGGFVTTQTGAPTTLYNRGTFSGASVAQQHLLVPSVLNQTGTSSFSQLILDQTQTALGSGAQRFIDLRVASTTTFAIASDATMPGQIQLPDGSASRPALAFLTGTNTGIYSNSGTDLRFSFAGTQRYNWTASSMSLAQNNATFTFSANGVRSRWIITTRMDNAADTSPGLTINQTTGSIGSSIDQSHVLIDAILNQTGTSSFSQLRLNQAQTSLGSGAQYFFDLRVANTTTLAIASDTTMPGQVQGPDGSAARPAYSFLNDPDTGIYGSAADVLSISAGGTARYSASATAFAPFADNAYTLGASGLRWSDLFAVTTTIGDLVMREPFPGQKPLTEVAHWRLIESLDTIHAYNIRTGKKYAVPMIEVEMDEIDHAIIARDRKTYGWEAAA